MSLLSSRRRELPLADRLAALREAVEIAEDRLEVPEVGRARTLLAKAGAREALGDATVVALAGATGSGKSTLFNALSGAEVSTPGVRRPTTGVAHATVWGAEGADRLLDWLQVPRRHRVDRPDPALDGLVLLDLPDHDSVRLEHRLEVDRLVELVDVLVWVLDPQKYADAAVHDRYLAPLAGHAGVLVVVLNQVDRLDEPAARDCLTDLRRLLDAEGLAGTPLLATSARTGQGLAELRTELARRVAARRAATDRLAADARSAAAALAAHCGSGERGATSRARDADEREGLADALADAAGVPAVVSAVERSALRRGAAHTGWPLLRWLGKLRSDPLDRLHLGDERSRTSLPTAGVVQQAAVTAALRRARDTAGTGLPQAWRDDLRRTAEFSEERLTGELDRAVAGTDLGPDRTPLWQRGAGALQWVLLLVALAGALWLLGLVALGWLQLDDVVPLPRVQGIPLPTLLLVGGLLAGALLALVARPLVALGARRRGRAARRRLTERVQDVADIEVLGPLEGAREDHRRFCAAVTRAGS
ncbi:MAG TPA: GTPase [Modestobacter sp.]|jgi:GTP-binding protein EngB required for normal cell division|nr:GTPase [Modestobacter sp.]